MPTHHDLIVTADSARNLAVLRLLGEAGVQLASRSVDFDSIRISRKQALFDLRSYLRLYVEPGHEEEEVARVGVFLAEEILGEEIFLALWTPRNQRHLRVQLPGATAERNPLGAALTRIPWEIARPSAVRETLAERNLLIRVVHDMQEPPSQPIDLGQDGSLRMLYVSAAARHSRPLSTRRERREIQRMFEREVYPNRKIVVDFLAHGVTRGQLHERVKDRGGYHVVHWSGHGHRDRRLELAGVHGLPDALSGQELLDLFFEAGGFLPRLVFLSACHSGDVEQVKDWQSFLATARGEEPGTRAAFKDLPERDIEIVEQPGYTGAAHALLQGGVPSVVAMRYAIGDEYALALALDFYRSLFVDSVPKTAVAALTLARKALLAKGRSDAARFSAADSATPVLYGAEDPGLRWANERSPSLDTRDRRLHRIAELTLADHPSFVGRGWELANLGTSYISTARNAEAKTVALITGLGGMGKTALAAEAFDLWNQRFEWVLLYQAKPNALSLESTLRDLHVRLYSEQGLYYRHVQFRPADAIHREAESDFTGPDRIVRLVRNLVRALRDEAILLVLDNFESNLKPEQEPGDSTEPLWACQDPDWDRCLALLATDLVGAPSRVLITCRRQLAALAGDVAPHCHRVQLKPLPAREAALFLREHPGLRRMVLGRDEAEKALAERLLQASRFHPLLMDRLARLAAGRFELREQLITALDSIETNHDATQLPELFAIERGDDAETSYLENALATSNDELILGASPGARRLLWMIAVANEPIELRVLWKVWPEAALAPPLRYLLATGLANKQRVGPNLKHWVLTCHELVRERIRSWMANSKHSGDMDLTENMIRLAYGERLESVLREALHKDMAAALEAGRRALVYCVQAEAWDRLNRFASAVVTSSHDPIFLASLLPHLKEAERSVPDGRIRWSFIKNLADSLLLATQYRASLPSYEQAATQALARVEAGGIGAKQAWLDLANTYGNWGIALRYLGDLDTARRRQRESVEALRHAGAPQVQVLGNEIEILRIDVLQGHAAQALPEIEARLAQLSAWWDQHRAGRPTLQAPEPEFLHRALIGALDIAKEAHLALRDWETALDRVDRILALKRALGRPTEDIGRDMMNRGNVLRRLNRFAEAKAEFEACLEIFQNDPLRKARTLGSLANLFDLQGDRPHAIELGRRALAGHELRPDPQEIAIAHSNLANYLDIRAEAKDREEAAMHRVAALAYFLEADLEVHLPMLMRNYGPHFLAAHLAGHKLAIPRVAEILANPAFAPLETWLRGRRVELVELQARVDQFLERAREAALGVTNATNAASSGE